MTRHMSGERLSLKRGTGNRGMERGMEWGMEWGMERGMERGMDEIRKKPNILKIFD